MTEKHARMFNKSNDRILWCIFYLFLNSYKSAISDLKVYYLFDTKKLDYVKVYKSNRNPLQFLDEGSDKNQQILQHERVYAMLTSRSFWFCTGTHPLRECTRLLRYGLSDQRRGWNRREAVTQDDLRT